MDDGRKKLGKVPAALTLRDLAPLGGLPSGLERSLVHAHGLAPRGLECLPLEALLAPLSADLRGYLVRVVRDFPVDGHDDPAANETGATIMAALSDGRLLEV